MNKDGSYTNYNNESNMTLFTEFLQFATDNFDYRGSSSWYSKENDKQVEYKDIFWAFMKTKIKKD